MLSYVYTEARRTYDTGLAFLHPLYYEWVNIAFMTGSKQQQTLTEVSLRP
jgi:alpha-glucosidase